MGKSLEVALTSDFVWQYFIIENVNIIVLIISTTAWDFSPVVVMSNVIDFFPILIGIKNFKSCAGG